MKKILYISLICLLTFVLVACSSNESSNFLTNQETQEQTIIQEEIKQEEVVEEVQQEEVVEEAKEEVKEETKKEVDPEVLKTYKYWVVFYDHEGNELQREAIKYGTVPTYWSDIPYYDDGTYWYKGVGWIDKWGREIKEFKPITGNTKFYAIYEKSGEVSHSSGGGETNPPGPPPYVPNCTSTDALVKLTGISGYGYQWTMYLYDGSNYVSNPGLSRSGGSWGQIDDLNGISLQVNSYYHVTYSAPGGFSRLTKILSECTTPGPDHGIPTD